MSDITLSRGVRSNLLNLQRTSDTIASTQQKLATGKRVNSALDNPSNFFTASSLNSRASDLGNLLDSMGSGIKTLEAADNGLKAITRTVESMQSTLRQARQDRSCKSTSFTLPTTPTGNIRFSGGAVGTTPVSIALGGANPTATTLNGGSAVSTSPFAGGNITVNGTNVAIRGDQAAVSTTLTGRSANLAAPIATGQSITINGTTVNINGDQNAIASSRNGTGGSDLAPAGGSANFGMGAGQTATITLTSGSNSSSVNITDASTNDDVTSTLAANGFTVTRGSAGLNISRADGASFTIATTGTNAAAAATISGQANGTVNNGTLAFSADMASVLTDIGNAGITGLTATDSGGQIALSLSSGADIQLGGNASMLNFLGFDSANRFSDNGSAAFDATATTVAADLTAANIAGLSVNNNSGTLELTLASGADLTLGGSDPLLTAIGFASSGRASTNGTEATGGTVDALVTMINSNSGLTDRVRASNDGGRLRIENLSTEELSVEGTSSAGNVTGGTGPANTSRIGGNEVRKNLISQFNELRGQLDKLSEDASFNGVNLLRGDKLKLTFNENGTSSIDIQAKDATGNVRAISNQTLGISAAVTGEFSSDATLDSRLDTLGNALTTLRSQSSAFGSNLSIVQNRTDFTKSMMTTLKTGADGLTLADMNEEAANLLSLQTRQQLSSTALSLANQADQGVLRLF